MKLGVGFASLERVVRANLTRTLSGASFIWITPLKRSSLNLFGDSSFEFRLKRGDGTYRISQPFLKLCNNEASYDKRKELWTRRFHTQFLHTTWIKERMRWKSHGHYWTTMVRIGLAARTSSCIFTITSSTSSFNEATYLSTTRVPT